MGAHQHQHLRPAGPGAGLPPGQVVGALARVAGVRSQTRPPAAALRGPCLMELELRGTIVGQSFVICSAPTITRRA